MYDIITNPNRTPSASKSKILGTFAALKPGQAFDVPRGDKTTAALYVILRNTGKEFSLSMVDGSGMPSNRDDYTATRVFAK